MYKGAWKPVLIIFLAVCIGGVSLALTSQVLAASDNSEITVSVNTEPVWMSTENSVSANVIPHTVTEEKTAPVVVIDPGHGGEDEGCTGEEITEKDINLKIALLVRSKLEDMGYQVIMTRETDCYVAKEMRVQMANEYPADIYVSIHQNASEEQEANGVEVWYDGNDETKDSIRLARLLHQQTVRKTGASERELQGESALHVTQKTEMPACLIETGFLSNQEEREKLVTEEYQEQIAEGIAQGIELYFHPKTMYLTFDDGPSKENTVRVLDALKEKNVKATFFVVGENVRKYPEVAKRIVEEGHAIGIHCDNHNYEVLYESVESYLADFEKAYETVREVTGVEVRLFRFPGGSVNAYNKEVSKEIVKAMTEKGFIYFDWNASLEDAVTGGEPEQLLANARETTLNRKKVVMLAHDVVYPTSLCIQDLIDQFPEYEMKVLTPEIEPITF